MASQLALWPLAAAVAFVYSPQHRLASQTARLTRAPLPLALEDGSWEFGEVECGHANPSTLKVAVAGKVLQFESGEMARQASGAVTLMQVSN